MAMKRLVKISLEVTVIVSMVVFIISITDVV